MESNGSQESVIRAALREISHLLPTQGPIDVFIHHNTLHAFDHLPFEEAVIEASKVYGAEAFLPEQRYLDEFRAGRITERDLETVIADWVQEGPGITGLTRRQLIKHFLLVAPAVEGFQEVKWLLRESEEAIPRQNLSAERLLAWLSSHEHAVDRKDALHRINFQAAEGLESIVAGIPRDARVTGFERVVLWASALLTTAGAWQEVPQNKSKTGDELCEEMVNPLLIRFCEDYLDLGFSNQLMPARSRGMLNCFLDLVDSAHFGIPKWLEPIRKDIARYRVPNGAAYQLLEALLNDQGVSQADYREVLLGESLSLRGWAGYVALVEHRPDMLHGQENEIRPRLIDYLCVRFLLRKHAVNSSLYRAKSRELVDDNLELKTLDSLYSAAFHLLRLCTILKCGDLLLGQAETVEPIVTVLLEFNEAKRRQLWHLAYENNLYARTLDALSNRPVQSSKSGERPDAQFVFCIDDREESIRRHVEARNSRYETYATAGFFGVDANLTNMRGSSAPYCPVIIQPTHAIREIPREGYEKSLSKYRKKQAAWFKMLGYVNRGSGSIVHNFLLSLGGCISLIPMLLGVMFPKTLRFFGGLFGSEPMIPADLHELQIEATTGTDAAMPGYTVEEMAARVVNVLRGIGLVDNFARLILFVGHGSSSRNNPLRSAYDCGACGGRPGRINARAICMMANDPKVREVVAARSGISIPEDTYFLGSFHNTCSDQIEYFDLAKSPEQSRLLLATVQEDLRVATKQNAFERCRRFIQSGVKSVEQAAEEALARSYMLAEARPEYGHATNAICVVGPRHFSKGLFLDRRSFLVSYDAAIDQDAGILLGILRAVVPVCGGINLEYLFSAMDNEVYGAGTKLPHNIVSLVGIMNGTSSDLRTGLPTQMVEIHEPVRLLLVVVATRRQLEQVIATDPAIESAFSRSWIKLVLRNVESGELEWRLPSGDYRVYEPSGASLAKIRDYREWLYGKSGHLPFAEVVVQ